MTTRGAKIRKKREARRKLGLPRTPSGQLSRSKLRFSIEAEMNSRFAIERKEQIVQTVKEARMRHFGYDEGDALDPLAGYALGRLRKAREISHGQHEAGIRWGDVCWRYHKLTGIPWPSPKALDYSALGCGFEGEESEDRNRATRRATDRYMTALGVIQQNDRAGRPCQTLLTRLVIQDEDASNWRPHMIEMVRKSLEALRDHFGIPEISDEKPAKAEAAEVA